MISCWGRCNVQLAFCFYHNRRTWLSSLVCKQTLSTSLWTQLDWRLMGFIKSLSLIAPRSWQNCLPQPPLSHNVNSKHFGEARCMMVEWLALECQLLNPGLSAACFFFLCGVCTLFPGLHGLPEGVNGCLPLCVSFEIRIGDLRMVTAGIGSSTKQKNRFGECMNEWMNDLMEYLQYYMK